MTKIERLEFLRDIITEYNRTHDDRFTHLCEYQEMRIIISLYDIIQWLVNINGEEDNIRDSTLILSNQFYAAFVQMQRRVRNG